MVDMGSYVWHHVYVYVQYTLHWSTAGLHMISVHAHVLSCDQDNTSRSQKSMQYWIQLHTHTHKCVHETVL